MDEFLENFEETELKINISQIIIDKASKKPKN